MSTQQATAAIKGGLYETAGVATQSTFEQSGALRRVAARTLSRNGMRILRELMLTLNGATAGSAASATYGRVAASDELGGVRTIETVTAISRNSAAADKTEIDADILSYESYDATPVANLDGNPLGTR